jgi:hypothetical protein
MIRLAPSIRGCYTIGTLLMGTPSGIFRDIR